MHNSHVQFYSCVALDRGEKAVKKKFKDPPDRRGRTRVGLVGRSGQDAVGRAECARTMLFRAPALTGAAK